MIQNIALKNVWHRLNGALVVGGVIVTYFKSSENYDHEWRFRNLCLPEQATAFPGEVMWTSPAGCPYPKKRPGTIGMMSFSLLMRLKFGTWLKDTIRSLFKFTRGFFSRLSLQDWPKQDCQLVVSRMWKPWYWLKREGSSWRIPHPIQLMHRRVSDQPVFIMRYVVSRREMNHLHM